jgi:hypothetical protein
MSNTTKKTVRISENDLVDLIDNIVNEAVSVQKQKWINEQAKKTAEKESLLENRIASLEKKISNIRIVKK